MANHNLPRLVQEAPFFHTRQSVTKMALITWLTLTLLAIIYAIRYEPGYLIRYTLCMVIAIGLEILWNFLEQGQLKPKSGSSLVTTAILLCSIPTQLPFLHLFFAIVVAVVIIRMNSKPVGIFLNPALMGRLFLMLAYRGETVSWSVAGVSSATPLDLYHSENFFLSKFHLFLGSIQGQYDFYTLGPSGPGENFIFLLLAIGIFLYWQGIMDWRPGIAFLLSFSLTMFIFREPVLYNLLIGSVVFASVYIAGDPRSTPATRSGRWIAGILAGVINALIRHYKPDHYSEGVVFSFLIVNLLAPSIDRLVFFLRSSYLAHQQNSFLRSS